MLRRTKLLLGEDKLDKLKSAHVAVFGVGGVGGYVCEMLARVGIGNITIVDFDVVDVSNINRQIIALNSTVGKPKVEVMHSRMKDINPDLNVTVINQKFCKDTYDKFDFNNYDYVVDAIDIVTDKVELIKRCHKANVNIVSAMGAGNRVQIPHFTVADIYKTYNDGLAKILRKKLREAGIEKHDVVFTDDVATNCGDQIGSISYYPAMCGCVLAGFVINQLVGE